MSLDFSRCRLKPFRHQKEDVQQLIEHPYFAIFSEMRTGKSKIVIDAAQFMFEAGTIDRVIVVAPAPVRDVWYDLQLGELAKHLWYDTYALVTEFHARHRQWGWGSQLKTPLHWIITNYEFIRSKNRLAQLLLKCTPKTLLVLDESSFVKTYSAQQTKACLQLRRACGRVVLLNGTPIFHSPLDLFSQGNILSPTILDCKYITMFKGRYAVQQPVLTFGGKPMTNAYGKAIQKISGWTNLDDLQKRFAPYTVRRMQAECLDLPPKLDPVVLTATLTLETWRAYKDMRDELVVWLQSGNVATSSTAAVKAMRLAQITAGFLGGIEDSGVDVELTNNEQMMADLGIDVNGLVVDENSVDEGFSKGEVDRQIARLSSPSGVQAIGREKLDVLLWFLGQRLEADPNLHVVVWCRFRAELFRVVDEVAKLCTCGHSQDEHTKLDVRIHKDIEDSWLYTSCQHNLCSCSQWKQQFEVASIQGGQKRADRLHALALLKPETSPVGPVFVAGVIGTGSYGLDMTASHTCVTMSDVYSPGKSAQTLDRVYGPGQTSPIAYFNIVAVGPKGQRTIDHDVVTARMTGEDVATRTAAAWIKALGDE